MGLLLQGDRASAGVPRDEQVPSKSSAAGVGETAAALGDKLAATVGWGSAPREEEGYSPKPGQPRDAAPSDAATGGAAAIVAPSAAAVAKGMPESQVGCGLRKF